MPSTENSSNENNMEKKMQATTPSSLASVANNREQRVPGTNLLQRLFYAFLTKVSRSCTLLSLAVFTNLLLSRLRSRNFWPTRSSRNVLLLRSVWDVELPCEWDV